MGKGGLTTGAFGFWIGEKFGEVREVEVLRRLLLCKLEVVGVVVVLIVVLGEGMKTDRAVLLGL